MNKMTKLAAAIALTSGALATAPAMAEGSWSANVGLASEYYFRGIVQTEDASASAGIDYENGGFYAGIWTADVSDGLEIDGYFGYGIETDSGLGLSLGYTTYQYTGDFDSEYNEVNFGLSFGIASIEYTVGTQEKDASLLIDETDYTFAALTLEHNGFHLTYGSFGDEVDGDYVEVGYSTEIGGFDAGIVLIANDEDLASDGEDDQNLIFTIGKSFDL